MITLSVAIKPGNDAGPRDDVTGRHLAEQAQGIVDSIVVAIAVNHGVPGGNIPEATWHCAEQGFGVMDSSEREEAVDDGGPRDGGSVGHLVEEVEGGEEVAAEDGGLDDGVPGDEVLGAGGDMAKEVDCFGESVVVGISEEHLGVEGDVRGRDLVQ